MADRKISDLTALTTPASGDYLPIVDISEAAAASKNKRITIEELFRGVPLGTAAAPSIAIEGDEDTGVFSPGANQLAVATNGVGRLFVDASGNVGVGATPSAAFHLTRSAADAVARIDGGSSNTAFIDFRIAGANKSYVGLGGLTGGSNDDLINYNSSAGNWIAYTSGTEKLRITAAGLVGIGTSAPGTTLEVSAGGGSSPSLTGTGGNFAITQPGLLTSLEFGGYSSAPYGLWLQTKNKTGGSFPLILNPLGGAVGIGTSAPSSFTPGNLVVEAATTAGITISDSTGGGTASIAFSATSSFQNKAKINCTMSSQSLEFSTVGSERARIDSSGRLLVGTSTNFGSGVNQVATTGQDAIDIGSFSTTPSHGGRLTFYRSKNATVGSATAVANDDSLGRIDFRGYGVNSYLLGARIDAFVDGEPSTGGDTTDMPCRLVFSTTADGASSPTERMRITSDAYVRLASGTGGIQFNGDTAAANALDDYEEGTWTPTATPNTSGTITLSSITASYTKIGNTVSIRAQATVSAVSSPLGYIDISLPFTNSGDSSGSVFFYNGDTGAVMSDFIGRVSGNVFRITFGTGQTGASSAPYARANTEITLSAVYRN